MLSPDAIIDGLIARGLPPHVAEGFVMNLADESGLDPGINEVAPIVPGSRGGFGLAQWTGPRRRALEAYAAERGAPASDPDLQLDFLVSELSGPERAAMDRIMATSSPGDAAAAVATHFLRPAKSHLDRRVAEYTGGGYTMGEPSGNALRGPDFNPNVPDMRQERANALMAYMQPQQAPEPADNFDIFGAYYQGRAASPFV